MSTVSWGNLADQTEGSVLVFLDSVDLSDKTVNSNGESIKDNLMNCYENFSSSRLIQAKVFEMLAIILRKVDRKIFTEDKLLFALHYAKNMISEWMSSSDVITNVLKFLTILFEKEYPGDPEEELVSSLGEVLRTHSHSITVQRVCLTFLCNVIRMSNIESFPQQALVEFIEPVIETIRSSKDEVDIVIKATKILDFLFERVADELLATSMDALDAVFMALQRHVSSVEVAATAMSFLSKCAIEDTHLIILSSTDKGFGLFCEFCSRFVDSKDFNAILSTLMIIKRACGVKIREITINSVPGLKKLIFDDVSHVRRNVTAAIESTKNVDEEDVMDQIVFACDGVLGSLDPTYVPDSSLDVSYSSKGKASNISRSVSSVDVSKSHVPISRANSQPLSSMKEMFSTNKKISDPAPTSLLAKSATGAAPRNKVVKAKRRNRDNPIAAAAVADNFDEISLGAESIETADDLSISNSMTGKAMEFIDTSVTQKDVEVENVGSEFLIVNHDDIEQSYIDEPVSSISISNTLNSPNVPQLNFGKQNHETTDLPQSGSDVQLGLEVFEKMRSFRESLSRGSSADNTPRNTVNRPPPKITKVFAESTSRIENDNEQRQLERLLQERNEYKAKCNELQSSLEFALASQRALEEESRNIVSREVAAIVQERDNLISEIDQLRATMDLATSLEDSNHRTSTRELERVKQEKNQLKLRVDEVESALSTQLQEHEVDRKVLRKDLEHLTAERDLLAGQLLEARSQLVKEKDALAIVNSTQMDQLLAENKEMALRLLSAEKQLVEAQNNYRLLEESNKKSEQLAAISRKSQEQAAIAVLRVEELHGMLLEATSKIESLIIENGNLKSDLNEALEREGALIQQQDELIAAYRVEAKVPDLDTSEVTLVDDDDEKHVVCLGDQSMHGEELKVLMHTINEVEEITDPPLHSADYEDESFYQNQSMYTQSSKKSPKQSATRGIVSALKFLGLCTSYAPGESNELDTMIEDLAELIQQYFNSIVKCPASDPTKTINHSLRPIALCSALCVTSLGLVDNKKLFRCDVEIILKRQKGVRLFALYGVAFTMILCIHKKHKFDLTNNDTPTLLFRLVELLSTYIDHADENENLWIKNSINQRQGLESPTRMRASKAMESCNDDEQFSTEDLMSASRLLNRELKCLLSIFECYPSYPGRSSSDITLNFAGEGPVFIKGRTLETVILIAKDFGICPQLMDRVQCISLIGREIRRSQNDADWTCPSGDILVSFSQFQIFLMNVALKNSILGDTNGFVTATQKLAGLLWWMDNSRGKERLHEKDRNFKVLPFKVKSMIPTLEAEPTGEDFWLEK